MDIITKESLNAKDPFGFGYYLKCDIPIWEEFTVGLEEHGHCATNNNFRGVRGILCKIPNSNVYKDIYIVTHNPKEQKFFEYIKDGYLKRMRKNYKKVNITKYERLDKFVYVIEFEYAK